MAIFLLLPRVADLDLECFAKFLQHTLKIDKMF